MCVHAWKGVCICLNQWLWCVYECASVDVLSVCEGVNVSVSWPVTQRKWGQWLCPYKSRCVSVCGCVCESESEQRERERNEWACPWRSDREWTTLQHKYFFNVLIRIFAANRTFISPLFLTGFKAPTFSWRDQMGDQNKIKRRLLINASWFSGWSGG